MFKLPEGFTVTAHTGAQLTRRNSLGSIRKAIAVGADITEMDVTFRPDGTPAIIHSASPAQNEGIPFDDALKEVAKSPSIRVNLDLKAFHNTVAVQEAVQKYGLLERVFYTGVGTREAAEVRAGSPEIPYYINSSIDESNRQNREQLLKLADTIIEAGGIGLNTQFRNLTPLAVEVMHEKGLLVSAWTVNKSKEQKQVLALGVDNITTTSPVKLRRIIKNG